MAVELSAVFINLRDRITYLPKLFAPEWIGPQGVAWNIQEAGGLAQITVNLAVALEQTTASAGDYLEVWVQGEAVPRARGLVTIPEAILALKEVRTLTAMGRMAHMDKVVLYETFFEPSGAPQDVSVIAAQLFSHYQKRLSATIATLPNLVSDVEQIGVNMQTLSLTPGTARQGMDAIFTQCAGAAVWGWDIDPTTGEDRFYLRPRVSSVGHQYFIGDRVQQLSAPAELDQLVNGMMLLGGPATYPNALTNASFETPQNPNASSGDLLADGGFETPYSGSGVYPGGDTNLSPWVAAGGVTRNMHDPATNHNGSAHTGGWYLLLDSTSKSVYQDVPVSLNAVYIASLYARLENSLHAATGQLTITGISTSGAQTETGVSIPIAPLSAVWTGGAIDSVIGSDAIQALVTFTNPATVKARVSLTCTSAYGGGFGLMIDDVVFDAQGTVGQLGWGTHVRNVGSAANVFDSIQWACAAAAWDGAFGVRCVVTASPGNECYINPAGPDLDSNSQYHFRATPQASMNVGFYVRMSPGIAAGPGVVRAEYREWAGDGHQDYDLIGANQTIPNDGLWHLVYITASPHGDASTASMQIVFAGNGAYDIDGAFAQDASVALPTTSAAMQDPVLASYIRGADFQRYVRAEDVATPGSAAALSASTWGRLEAVVTNKQIIGWGADAETWAAAYFGRAAVLLNRPQATIIEPGDTPGPGDGLQVQISGTGADPSAQWCSKSNWKWSAGTLIVDLELNNERPTLAKILLQYSGASAGSSGGGALAGAGSSGGGGVTTQAPSLRLQTDAFTISGTAYMLSQTPDGAVLEILADGVLQTAANYAVSGATLTLASGFDLTLAIELTATYSY